MTVVYVGLEEGAPPIGIDAAAVEAAQPASAVPVRRLQDIFLGIQRPLGIEYQYDVESVFADTTFEDAFFEFLTTFGAPNDPTPFQLAYSDDPRAAEQITSMIAIDADRVESWLVTNAASRLGVDTARPTVFFINWYGRPDFQFHLYYNLRRPPDLSIPFPFGLTAFGLTTAWGGGTPDDPYAPLPQLGRTWFYDVSAGPDFISSNWDLTTEDLVNFLDPFGEADNRLPPIWEYGTDHWYRPFDDLSADLAGVLRYVAIDLLFTPSPIYDPALSPPLLVDDLNLDLNSIAAVPGHHPASELDFERAVELLLTLDPTRRYTIDHETIDFDPHVRRTYSCYRMSTVAGVPSCFPEPGLLENNYGDLVRGFEQRNNQYLDGERYEIPIALFDLPNHWAAGNQTLGIANDDGSGLQSWLAVFDSPRARAENLRSQGRTFVHEIAHHLGLSHTYDGYDASTDTHLFATNDKFFVGLGSAVASIMGRWPHTDTFSQFDRDNMDRWMTAVRLQYANRILADIYASPKAGLANAALLAADAAAGAARQHLADWELSEASVAAAAAYAKVLEAAARVGVRVESWSARQDQGEVGFDAWGADPVLTGSARLAARPASRPALPLDDRREAFEPPTPPAPSGVDVDSRSPDYVIDPGPPR